MKAVLQWVLRTMMKAKGETGIVQTMPKRDIVEMNTQITAQRLMQNGIDPNSLKNADQVENAIIAIENRRNVQTGFTTKKSADVFDLEGRKIDTSKGIMGGKQIDDLPPGDPDLPPPGSRGGPDDIAAPVQSAEETMKNMIEDELMKSENPFSDLVKTTKKGPKTIKEREAEILASMEKSNKETVQRIKQRKMVDDAIDNMSPSLSGDTKIDAELVAEDLAERMGKVYDDLPTKERLDLYDQAFQALTKKKFDPDGMAQGGRAGFANGSKGLLDLLDIQASGSKSGKQKIKGAPDGFTIDSETYNFIVNADIPINEKINLLTTYGRGKGRDKIEKDGQELFLGEGGSRIREIGLDINPDAERGFSGNIMYNPDSDDVKGGITYKFADGGRIGYKIGSIDKARRAFLKAAAGVTGGVAALKTGLLGLGKEAAPTTEKVIEKVATSDVPPYFLNLVNKIKNLGQKFDGPKERSESFTYKDYEMDIDYDTGAIEIKKTKESMIPGGDEAGISEEVYMTYKPGMADETTKGKKVVDEYEEFTARPDMDGKMKDVDEGVPDEVIKEGTMFEDNITEFGKAAGGIARMLGE